MSVTLNAAAPATFGPSMGLPLAGLWSEYVGWQWAFWQIILPSLLAMACVAWGLPQGPLRLERFAQFDWRGLLLGLPAISALVIGLSLGERMGWFDSPLINLLQIFGQPMAVIPLLMLATGGMTAQDGPFASAWFNTVKGLASVLATGVLEALATVRRHFHSNHLVDSLGNAPLTDAGVPQLARRIHEQALVLAAADLYLCMALLAAALTLWIAFVPTRIYPPRAVA